MAVNPGATSSVRCIFIEPSAGLWYTDLRSPLTVSTAFYYRKNRSMYISVGVVHAVENGGKVHLELIDIQSASYRGEDDIVLFEDQYGRV